MKDVDTKSGAANTIANWSIAVLATITLIALGVLWMWADNQLATRARQELGRELNVVLGTTNRAVEHWISDLETTVSIWATDPETTVLVQSIMELDDSFEVLTGAPEQDAFVKQLRPVLRMPHIQGLSLYAPDGRVFSSTRLSDLGRVSPDKEVLSHLARVIESDTGAHISLPLKGYGSDFAVILASCAIRNHRDDTIAVLSIRVNPEGAFTEILQRGRMGESGESYAFNADGKMISESRFVDDLRELALVSDMGVSILTVDIRNPGGNLLEGFRPKLQRELQPLTLMAQSAIDGMAGHNLEGYNDYRGVQVVGAWIWNDDYRFGIATEIDVAEAFRSLVATQRLFLLLVLFSAALVVILTTYFVRSRTRIGRALERAKLAEAQSRLLLESVRDGIFGVDRDGRVMFINPAGLSLLQYSREELMGESIHDIIHHSRADGTPYPVEECPMRAAFTKDKAALVDDEVLWCKDGQPIDVEYTAVPMREGEKLVGAVIVFRDIRERKEKEHEIAKARAERERYAEQTNLILENATDGIVTIDDNQVILRFNPACEKIWGYTAAEVVGRSITMLLPEYVRADHLDHVHRFRDSRIGGIHMKDRGLNLTGRRKNGELFPAEVGISMNKVDDAYFYSAFVKDITERKRAETILNRQSTALEAAVDGIAITDTEGTLVWVNPAFTVLTGYSREEAIGQNPRVLKSGAHDAAFYENMWKTIAAGRVWNGEVVNKRKDGSVYTEEMSITPVRDANGDIVNYVAIKRDITERKAAERRFRSVTESANDAVISSNSTSIVVGWNRAAAEMFGWSEEEIVGKPVETIIPERFHASHKEGMDRVTATGDAHVIGTTVELSGLHREGHEFPIEMSLSTWTAGDDTFFTGIIRDITERKAMEAELERARKRMEDELNVGREIQLSMLPLTFPAYPERNEFSVYAVLHPAREVGGDFYDFFFIDDHRLCCCVGDVSGKGVPSALFMAVTRTLIQATAKRDVSPALILTHVNDELSHNNETSMFVTVFIGVLDVRTGALAYGNAGHNPPYVKRADGSVQRLAERHGPVLGARAGLTYTENHLELHDGDLLLTYTDGVTEAMNPSDELFSETRLQRLLEQDTFYSVEETVEATVTAVREFESGADQADDITVMALRYRGQDEPETGYTLRLRVQNQITEIDRVNARFNEFAGQHKMLATVRQKINILFDEMMNNIISYAFDDDADHVIEIDVELRQERLTIQIADDGIPFNPFDRKEPDTEQSLQERQVGGLGIHLVRKLMDDVHYERRDNKNIVKLSKRL